MKAPFTCNYLHNSGKVCGNACTQPEGCRHHWKTRKRYLYTDCGKPTSTACERCALHIRGYYVMQYFNKLQDKAQILDQMCTDISIGET